MLWGYLLVLLSAAGFGLMTIFASYAYEAGVSVVTVLFLRFAFASLIFFSYIFIKIRAFRVSKKQLGTLFLLGGVMYTLQSTFYFSSVQYISASLAALLLYLFPIFVAILSFFVNKERLTKGLIASMLFSFIGMVFVLGSPDESLNIQGILFAIGAAVVYSFYIVLGNRMALQIHPMITSAFIALFATLSFLCWGLISDDLHFQFSLSGWLPILGIALFSTVVAMFTFFAGMNITGPTRASILSMIEPVVTTIFAILLLDDHLSISQIVGGSIVLLGAIMVVLSRQQEQAKPTQLNG